jgi:hypothetical protein
MTASLAGSCIFGRFLRATDAQTIHLLLIAATVQMHACTHLFNVPLKAAPC